MLQNILDSNFSDKVVITWLLVMNFEACENCLIGNNIITLPSACCKVRNTRTWLLELIMTYFLQVAETDMH